MGVILRIFKINIFAIVSFLFLLISIVAKLVLKALEKAAVFLCVGGVIFVLALFSMILKNPGGFFQGIGWVIAFLVIFGIIIGIIVAVFSIFAGVFAVAFTIVISVLVGGLSAIFGVSHDLYAKLYDICKIDFEKITNETKNNSIKFFCLMWYLLRGFNYVIVTLFSIAFPVSILMSISLFGFSIWSIHSKTTEVFGIGMFSYLKMFPTIDAVFLVIYFVILLSAMSIVIVSLGIEWGEWGKLLKLSTQNYQDYRTFMAEQAEEINATDTSMYSFEEGEKAQKCQKYLEIFSDMCNDIESLQQQVDTAMHMKYDTSIVYDFGEYTNLLGQISKKFDTFKSDIPCKIFEAQFIPQIEIAKRLVKDISKSTLNIINKASASFKKDENKEMKFFEGCETEEETKKRYKALCKVYHPDAGGHEGTFKILLRQYEEKTKTMSYEVVEKG